MLGERKEEGGRKEEGKIKERVAAVRSRETSDPRQNSTVLSAARNLEIRTYDAT